ncbi:MAG: hypothetical protein Q8S84_07880 [bacterium]|nr:hypothetical protein [bacterium]MDP3381357.1 hypothetical protein [bacterium]
MIESNIIPPPRTSGTPFGKGRKIWIIISIIVSRSCKQLLG